MTSTAHPVGTIAALPGSATTYVKLAGQHEDGTTWELWRPTSGKGSSLRKSAHSRLIPVK